MTKALNIAKTAKGPGKIKALINDRGENIKSKQPISPINSSL